MTNDNKMHIGFKQVLRRAFLFVWRGAYPLSPIEGNYQTALKRPHKWVLALTWCDIWMRVWRVLGISRLRGTWSLLVLMTAHFPNKCNLGVCVIIWVGLTCKYCTSNVIGDSWTVWNSDSKYVFNPDGFCLLESKGFLRTLTKCLFCFKAH